MKKRILIVACGFFVMENARALDEIFHDYAPPRALAMGNAVTADAIGHTANFYNGAGHAKLKKREKEWHIVDVQIFGGLAGYSRVLSTQSWGLTRITGDLQNHPNEYTYYRFNAISAFAKRGFGVAVLTAYEYAAESDGTTVDMSSRWDNSLTFGVGSNFFGNYLKVGIVGKALIRNELVGEFAHSALSTDDQVEQNSREGYGFGADVGAMFTLPYHSLPTLAVTWKDAFDTHFTGSSIFNTQSGGAPSTVEQSVNAAFSLHPAFTAKWKVTMALELKHLERTSLSFRKKLHTGLEIRYRRRWFLRLGANQGFITGGMALHLPGGHFEVGTYAVDVGLGDLIAEDRRYFLRYTLSFQ